MITVYVIYKTTSTGDQYVISWDSSYNVTLTSNIDDGYGFESETAAQAFIDQHLTSIWGTRPTQRPH